MLAGLSLLQAAELFLSIQLSSFFPSRRKCCQCTCKGLNPCFCTAFGDIKLFRIRGIYLQTHRALRRSALLYLSRSSMCLAAQCRLCLPKLLLNEIPAISAGSNQINYAICACGDPSRKHLCYCRLNSWSGVHRLHL